MNPPPPPGLSGRAPRRGRRAALAAALCALVASLAAGEPAGKVAILEQAPHPRQGIAWLGPNTLPSLAATYRYEGSTVEVSYTAAPIPPRSSWPPGECSGTRVVPSAASAASLESPPVVLFYHDQAGWSLFFSFSGESSDPGRCSFVERFLPSFLSFLSATNGEVSSSFPAVLQ